MGVFYVGDVHGKFGELKTLIDDHEENFRSSCAVQVGDFGLGFSSSNYFTLEDLNNKLMRINCIMAIIRGNHDIPYAWIDGRLSMLPAPKLQAKAHSTIADMYSVYNHVPVNLSNIWLVPDWTVIEDGKILTENKNQQQVANEFAKRVGKNMLFVGGAISVDRLQRVEGSTYWSSEPITPIPKAVISLLKTVKFDAVVTHSAPDDIAKPFGFTGSIIDYYTAKDSNLLTDLRVERGFLKDLYLGMAHKPKDWIYGHFHAWHNTVQDETQFNCIPELGCLYR